MLSCSVLAGCSHWKIPAPVETTLGQPADVRVEPSYIGIDLVLPASLLEQQVRSQYAGRTLFKGRSPEISARLLITRRTPEERIRQILVSPARAAGCAITGYRQHRRRTCSSRKPWGCISWVYETITTPIRECWAAAAAVYRDEVETIIAFKEEVAPTSVWLDYGVDLDSISIKAVGEKLRVNALLDLTAKVDVKQGLLSATTTARGALKCDAVVAVDADARIKVTAGGDLDLALEDIKLDWRRLCAPGALEAAQLQTYLSPGALIATTALEAGIKEFVKKAVNKQLERVGADIALPERLREVAVDLNEPIRVGPNAWLQANPTAVFVSTPRGAPAENAIRVNAGVVAHPIFSVGARPQDTAIRTLGVKREERPNVFSVLAEGRVPLQEISAALEAATRRYVAQNRAIPVKVKSARVYQSGKQLVIAIDMKHRNELLRGAGTIYLTATPVLSDEKDMVSLKDVRFDLDTRNALLKIADKLANSEIERYLESQASYKYGGDLAEVRDKYRSFKVPVGDVGEIHGTVNDLKERAIWVAEGRLNLLAEANGSATLELDGGCRTMRSVEAIPKGYHPVTVEWKPGAGVADLVCIAKTQGPTLRLTNWLNFPLPQGYRVVATTATPVDTALRGCSQWSVVAGQYSCNASWTQYDLAKDAR